MNICRVDINSTDLCLILGGVSTRLSLRASRWADRCYLQSSRTLKDFGIAHWTEGLTRLGLATNLMTFGVHITHLNLDSPTDWDLADLAKGKVNFPIKRKGYKPYKPDTVDVSSLTGAHVLFLISFTASFDPPGQSCRPLSVLPRRSRTISASSRNRQLEWQSCFYDCLQRLPIFFEIVSLSGKVLTHVRMLTNGSLFGQCLLEPLHRCQTWSPRQTAPQAS